jgi:plastocyanin
MLSFLKHQVLTLVLLILVLLGVSWFAVRAQVMRSPSTAAHVDSPTSLVPAPLYDETRSVSAMDKNPFSAVVSYTDQGFEPSSVLIHTGETVRFINNAAALMVLSLSGAPKDTPSGDYWQHTFTQAGDVEVGDAKGAMVVIHVQ